MEKMGGISSKNREKALKPDPSKKKILESGTKGGERERGDWGC